MTKASLEELHAACVAGFPHDSVHIVHCEHRRTFLLHCQDRSPEDPPQHAPSELRGPVWRNGATSLLGAIGS